MRKELQKLIKKAACSLNLGCEVKDGDVLVEFSKDEKLGDFSTNAALILGKKVSGNPLEIAENLKNILEGSLLSEIEKVEIAKPGFINFHLSQKYFENLIEKIISEKENFGNSEIGSGVKINNEFISANPTGPLHLGNGRGGFFGDALSNVFKKTGHEVVREYYINDGGEQIEKLGHSVLKDSEAVYSGEYIDKLNEKYKELSKEEAGKKSVEDILDNIIKKTVSEKMKINFDSWVSERKDIIDKGYPEKAILILKEKGLIYEKEDATWFKSTEFGDDKDRVLIKSDGRKTYFAIDCGYILDKIERGFGKIIMNLGADHHGYTSRFEAATKALGFEGELKFIIYQLVRLMKDGKEVRMSKRSGNVVYVDDLIEKIGSDVARFFFLMYSPDTHLNFNLGLAQERSQKNPVFYVQYAHARICSILGKTKKNANISQKADLALLKDEKELSLIKELNKFPELMEEISANYNVQKLPQYVIKIADKFHSFYNACQVIDDEKPELTTARLKLISAVKIVLSESLNIIGVEAPEKM